MVTHGLASTKAAVWPGFPSEDHVPVGLEIPGLDDLDLGVRVVCAAPIPEDAGEPAHVSVDIPRADSSWEAWTDIAEDYLAQAFGMARGPARRGCGTILKPCTLSGPQNLAGDVVDQEVRRLEDLVRGARRLHVLELCGGGTAYRGASTLRAKLGETDIPAAQAALEEARKALRARRLKAWKSWVRGNL